MEMIEIINESETNQIEQNIPENPLSDNELLKPGAKIRPEASVEIVENLAERLYGITIKDIKEIISYDDRNFLIHEDRNIKNPLIPNAWPQGYILKILNCLDSKKLNFVDAQTQLMIYLRKQKFMCPNPIKNVYGNYYSTELINGNNNVVRLLEFLPGQIFHEVLPLTNHLFYQAGEYIAKLDMALKNFNHDAYKTHRTLWMLQSVPKLEEFIYIVEDHSRKQIVEEIIEAFKKNVLTKINSFEMGIIHGDFNEHNILVNKLNERNEYRIVGILDFGDTSHSPLVFELAIAMCYMILQSQTLATGGIVMAGYNSVRIIPNKEKQILKYCIAARLSQSLVLGAYTHSLDPSNEYLLTTQKAGWDLLKSLWRDNADKVDEIWATTADIYLTQSVK